MKMIFPFKQQRCFECNKYYDPEIEGEVLSAEIYDIPDDLDNRFICAKCFDELDIKTKNDKWRNRNAF